MTDDYGNNDDAQELFIQSSFNAKNHKKSFVWITRMQIFEPLILKSFKNVNLHLLVALFVYV